MAEIHYKRPFIKGCGGSRRTDRSTDTAARSAGEVGVKSEPWVSPIGCVCGSMTHSVGPRSPCAGGHPDLNGTQEAAGLVLRTFGEPLPIKGQVIRPVINVFLHGKGLPDVSSPLVTFNLPNPHRHHSLCPAGFRGTAPCPLPVS